MLYLVLAVFVLHFLSVPLVIGVTAAADSDGSAGKINVRLFFVPVFSKRIDLGRLKDMTEGRAKPPAPAKKHGGKLKSFLLNAAKETATRVNVRDMDMTARIGTGDAAATAFAVGTVSIIYAQTCALLSVPYDGDISPDYDRAVFFMRFSGIFSITAADIIFAVITAAGAVIGRTVRRSHGNVAQ